MFSHAQVMKTCEKLRQLNFHSIRMMEVRQRPYDARVIDFDTLDLGLTEEEEFINNKSARDPHNQFQRPLHRTEQAFGIKPTDGNRSPVDEEAVAAEEESDNHDVHSLKRRKIDEESHGVSNDGDDLPPPEAKSAASIRSMNNRIRNRPKSSVSGSYQMQIARPITIMKGHTAFLTFAVCPLSKS